MTPRPRSPGSATKAFSAFRELWEARAYRAGRWCRAQATPSHEGHGAQGRIRPLGDVGPATAALHPGMATQAAQTAVCNRHHTVDQQLCRWLLLSLDRLSSNQLTTT